MSPESLRGGRFRRARCPACGGTLIVHQPDPDLIDRFLVVCEECRRWYVADDELRRLVCVLEGGGPGPGRD